MDSNCAICSKLAPGAPAPLFENELWHVVAMDQPCPVPGWVMLISKRHLPGPAAFDDREAESFGPTFRHLQRVLLEVSGALRVYSAAMGESSPHFHCHLVPRYAEMPKEARGWAVFDLLRAAAAGEVSVDRAAIGAASEAYGRALAASPPPLPR
jgi:diadenosine tetraphosphate (Ap4A) HIT family hydrolase